MSGWAKRFRELLDAAEEAGERGLLLDAVADCLGSADGGVSDGESGRFGMIGTSPVMAEVYAALERIVETDITVLIQGATGTGKELVAIALHQGGARAKGPFIATNCAAIPETLLESELFGHVRGAFTGAVADRKGRFVEAHQGTIFLDEIGEMSPMLQVKLLRVLQEGEVRPVGGNSVAKVDVRIVAATNRDLDAMLAEGSFREDLYYRLNVVNLTLPPLSERDGDLALLVDHFLAKCGEAGEGTTAFSDDALSALAAYPWPGNVRELENEVRRAVALGRSVTGRNQLSPHVQQARSSR